jgi:AraC-like DNA-binding protein
MWTVFADALMRDGHSPFLHASAADALGSAGARAAPAKGTPTVSMVVVRGLVGAAESAGAARVELLRAAGLDPELLLSGDARIALREVFRLCAAALALTGDDALGLHWAERLTGTTFVPVSYLMAHSGSFRQALESLTRFGSLLSDWLSYELVERGGKLALRCLLPDDEPEQVRRFTAEMTVASFVRIIRSLDVAGQPEQVSFEYAAPPHAQEYARIFAGAARFEQPFTGVVFDPLLLKAAPPDHSEDIHEALRTLAERRIARLGRRMPYALRVRELLIQRGWPERLNMRAVARALGLSVRSLRRHLASESKSYGELESDAFATVATRLLRDKQRTIQEAAYEMGFSDASTFHRAFKRATGTTPGQYRHS